MPDTFSASVTNTAATLAIAAFIGVIDMFFKFEETKERAEERRQWEARLDQTLAEMRTDREAMREEIRAERNEIRAEREEARAQREQNQQMFAALMEQNRLLADRLLGLLERRNGSGDADAS